MHMADALISTAVGGTLWAASAGLIGYAAYKVRAEADEARVPLMGVTAAFVFAAQMVNFAIPGTGASGHIGGGLLLAMLLGPHAAFLAMASVLTIQALFFADGGLLALGCNIFNLGFFTSYVVYPWIFKPLVGRSPAPARLFIGSLTAAAVGLQLGALGVVFQTTASGVSELPFNAFLLLMLPIHLAIGVGEGLATAAVALFIRRAQPEILDFTRESPVPLRSRTRLLALVAGVTLVTAVVLSRFASDAPDGLEWSTARVAGKEVPEAPADGLHDLAAALQKAAAFLPDYAIPAPQPSEAEAATGEPQPGSKNEASLAGLVGSLLTLAVAGAAVRLLRRRRTAA